MNGIGMNFILVLVLIPLMVASAQENEVRVVGPDRVQEFHACVGTTAYIPWPLNVVSREMHKSTVITLVFQRRYSEKKTVVATFNAQGHLKAEKPFIDRLRVSSENSGVFLKRITYDDAGTYIAQARKKDRQVWTRTTNLTVHMRPIVHGNRLNMTQSEVLIKKRRIHCVNITCGTLEYAGYPPAKFVWTTATETLAVKTATDDSSSSVQICSPYFGDVTCSIAGFSSVCTYDHVTTLHLDLPGPPANSSSVGKASMTRDLVLIIVMPILAVAIPLAILIVWVLSHLLKSYPHYRERRHYENREPQADPDIEDNVTTEQTHNYDDMSEIEDEQTEIKEEIRSNDEENHIGEYENVNDNNDADNGQDEAADNNNDNDDDSTKDADDDDDDDEDGDDDDDDHKANEERPLMEDSINPVA